MKTKIARLSLTALVLCAGVNQSLRAHGTTPPPPCGGKGEPACCYYMLQRVPCATVQPLTATEILLLQVRVLLRMF